MTIAPASLSVGGIQLPYPVATIGTAAILVLWWLLALVGRHSIGSRDSDPKERYRKRQVFSTFVAIISVVAIVLLWARLLEHTGTFLGILGAGLAIALREPLLSVAGRIAIFASKMYRVGDRIEINKLTGDVIDVGFFYTRMMEIGNWIHADQASGRIVQFANAQVFGTPVFNYTRDLSFIWDEVFFPVTYDSNIKAMSKLMLDVGGQYTREYLQGAEQQLEHMKNYFLVPSVELKPNVYLKVTDNWIELRMRYVVDPKQRRSASNFIYSGIFDGMQGRKDIAIGSSTMDLTIHGRDSRSESKPKPNQPKAA